MRAIISDVHSNLEALHAVLADIAEHGVDEIYCLGDMVGYGPNPREALDLLMPRCQVTLMGNHDQAALFDPASFNKVAEKATYWTRGQLDAPQPTRKAADLRWEFLGDLPQRHREEEILFVHASPRQPVTEYIMPEDIYNERKLTALFQLNPRTCFHGHTHLPGILTESMEFFSPEEIEYAWRLDGRKVFCNVGSVGQPRDGDWRACYVLFDGETVYYRRVEYDVETTVQKIEAIPELDNFLANRLRHGQ